MEELPDTGSALGRLEKTAIIVSSLAAAVSAMVAVVIAVQDDPPARRTAAVGRIAVSPKTPLKTYLVQTGQLESGRAAVRQAIEKDLGGGLTSADSTRFVQQFLAVRGDMVFVEVTLSGFRQRPARVQGFIYNRRTGQPAQLPSFPGVEIVSSLTKLGFGSADIPQANIEKITRQLWLAPGQDVPGRFFVRIELFDQEDRLLAFRDSTAFTRPDGD